MRTAELLAHKDSVQISVLRDDKILARLLAGKKKKTLPVEHTIVSQYKGISPHLLNPSPLPHSPFKRPSYLNTN